MFAGKMPVPAFPVELFHKTPVLQTAVDKLPGKHQRDPVLPLGEKMHSGLFGFPSPQQRDLNSPSQGRRLYPSRSLSRNRASVKRVRNCCVLGRKWWSCAGKLWILRILDIGIRLKPRFLSWDSVFGVFIYNLNIRIKYLIYKLVMLLM